MFLKRIEVHGFKSFAEATVVTFEPSITAIVGPNGSGKSNIVDAIRWVLGEQSAKSLRGSKMEDVIFSGSDKRKPMTIAQVKLIMDNSDGSFNIDEDEVVIGRRVNRNGESDYLLNGTVCRLKDIEELLMDTGMGKEAYSIIGQGKIDSILSSKATDRRELFEEAAGIIKYKTRKLEAAKKMDETELNLARVEDIINELDRQADPLKKQAEDARKYKEYSSELKELEESLLLTHWTVFQKELNMNITDRDRLVESLAERESLADSFEAKVVELQNELDQINELIDQKQERYFELKTQREGLENRIAMVREKQQSLILQQNRISAESKERETMIEKNEQERIQITQSLQEIGQTRQRLTATSAEEKVELTTLQEQIETDIQQSDTLRAELMGYLNARTELESRYRRLKDEDDKLTARIDELIQLRSRSDRHLDEAVTQLQHLEAELKQTNDDLLRITKEEDALRQCQAEDQAELVRLQEHFSSLREELHGAESRLKILKDLEHSMEGYFQGVKNVLRVRENLTGIVGVVAELIQVDESKERAITAALAGGLQNIIVETGEDAKKAIEQLKRTRGGRATFLPLDMVRGTRMTETPQWKSVDGYMGIASDFVQADARLMPVVLNLLGRIAIARDMDAALQLSRVAKHNLRIVTLDGDQINPGGAVSGGSVQQQGPNLLGRTREIEELTHQVERSREELHVVREKGAALKTRVTEQDQTLRNWQQELHQLELKRVNLRKDQQQLKKDTEAKEDHLSNVDQEFETCHEQLGHLDLLLQQTKTELDLLYADNTQKEVNLKELDQRIATSRARISQIQHEITEARVKLASLDEQERSHYARLEQIRQFNAETTVKIEGLRVEWQELEGNKGELEEQVHLLESEKNTVQADEQVFGEEVSNLKQQERDLSGAFKKEDARARAIRRRANELSKDINQFEVKIAELTSKLESVITQLKEEHNIDMEHFTREITLVEDIEGVEKRIRSLKWRLRVLGTVNLAAEEEYTTLTKRLSFLKEQFEDLSKARESLAEMIAELDETIKERFVKTFEKVRDEFKVVFTKLFGGGAAELHLSNPDDLLETGIEINAQPPGKKLQKISLMSGGEKALTALALIFAFLKVKPSPFYILDEIDAPLDEANVDRFAAFVREFSNVSQFIIITHRKGTMAEADALYGVTMEESGVSKLISYKFAEKAS